MNELDKKTLAKYLYYLVDYSEQLLNNHDLVENDLEDFVKEVKLFQLKVSNSAGIESNLMNAIQNLSLNIKDNPNKSKGRKLLEFFTKSLSLEGLIAIEEYKHDDMIEIVKVFRNKLSHLILLLNSTDFKDK